MSAVERGVSPDESRRGAVRTSWMLLASEKVACATCSAEAPAAAIVRPGSMSGLLCVRWSKVEVAMSGTPLGFRLCPCVDGLSAPRTMASEYASARVGSRAHAGCRQRLSYSSPTRRTSSSLTIRTLTGPTFASLTRPRVVVLLLRSS